MSNQYTSCRVCGHIKGRHYFMLGQMDITPRCLVEGCNCKIFQQS